MESFDGFEFGSAYKGEPVEEIGGVLLPEDYLEFMREHNGGEGEVGGTYLVLFPLEELETVYDNYDLGRVLPGYVAIGGDGGGERGGAAGRDHKGGRAAVAGVEEEHGPDVGRQRKEARAHQDHPKAPPDPAQYAVGLDFRPDGFGSFCLTHV